MNRFGRGYRLLPIEATDHAAASLADPRLQHGRVTKGESAPMLFYVAFVARIDRALRHGLTVQPCFNIERGLRF